MLNTGTERGITANQSTPRKNYDAVTAQLGSRDAKQEPRGITANLLYIHPGDEPHSTGVENYDAATASRKVHGVKKST